MMFRTSRPSRFSMKRNTSRPDVPTISRQCRPLIWFAPFKLSSLAGRKWVFRAAAASFPRPLARVLSPALTRTKSTRTIQNSASTIRGKGCRVLYEKWWLSWVVAQAMARSRQWSRWRKDTQRLRVSGLCWEPVRLPLSVLHPPTFHRWCLMELSW